MNNWLIFISMIMIMVVINRISTMLLKVNTNVEPPELVKIRKLKEKTIEDQKKYLDILEKRDDQFGNIINKYIYIVIMAVGLSYLYVNNLTLMVIICILISLIYSMFMIPKAHKNTKIFEFITMFLTYIFICSFIFIQEYDPLYINGIKLNYFYLLIILVVFSFIINKIEEKIFKHKSKDVI